MSKGHLLIQNLKDAARLNISEVFADFGNDIKLSHTAKGWHTITHAIKSAQSGRPIQARKVAGLLNFHVLKVEQAVTELAREKYVQQGCEDGENADDILAERGRKYLIENNLLGEVGTPAARQTFRGVPGRGF